jgi:hypothetical protein
MLSSRFEHVHYFPAYEVIMGTFNRGAYFAHDLRRVQAEGVRHVMELFVRHAMVDHGSGAPMVPHAKSLVSKAGEAGRNAESILEVECDEVALDGE